MYDVQFSHAGRKRLRHPRLGLIAVSHAAFHVAERPEQTLVVYHLPTGTDSLDAAIPSGSRPPRP
ncbi:hypothetical protein [Micromonospora sp. HK10]|uniref:MmyB family transcriptional regulator n=1 Tax=Micromonospora sp. HK10 TaxID=1538294 RepID=UPI00350FE37D